MPIQSNLSISPYFDDYEYESDYYRVLFKPSTAVQVRELNQLQTILQRQIEEFGDVVLQRGTLLDGCQASFSPDIPFVKLLDVTVDGAAVDLASYVGLFARGDNDNVIARISDAIQGFEAQDPNLKTLYLDYLNSGDSLNSNSFVEGETIEIYNIDHRLYDINVINGSTNFSNSDNIVILSAIEVQNSSNTGGSTDFANSYVVGERLTGPNNQEVEIVEVDTTANTNAITLRIKPLASQLRLANTASWLLANGDSVVSSNSNNDAVISRIIGSGARANFQTTRTGIVGSVTLEQGGFGYTTLPFVTISSTENVSTSDLDTLDLQPENYTARVQIATNGQRGIENPTTGVGYGMSVTEGKVYQKGHFLRVNAQNIIVSKYSSVSSITPGPDNVAVGFVTNESIANAAVDPRLNDNAAGFLNQNAPGADRLELVPELSVKTLAEAESDSTFFPIYKFSQGQPYSQRTDVQFNKVADELAKRTYEESGNYVLNPFEITTRSSLSIANSDTSFTYLIDPGLAYVNGRRVETVRNFAKNVDKSTETESVSNTSIDLVYGNYVRCNEFAGLNSFNNGDLIELHGTAGDTISSSSGVVSDPNDQIGTARVRSITHETGIQGSSDAVYRVYLFDIRMNEGRNFKSVRSLYSTDGIGDVVLESNPRGEQIAVLKETKQNSLLVNTRRPIKSLDNITYRYRTSKEEVNVTAAGTIQVARDTGAVWPYTGELTTTEKNQLIVLPEGDLVGANNLTGVVSGSGSTLNGNTTNFTGELQVGDFVAANGVTAQITGISNNTVATISPSGALDGIVDDVFQRVYPKDVPIPLATRIGANAEVSGNNLLIDVGLDLSAGNTATVVYNQQVNDATSVAKTTSRLSYVKIQANTHPETTNGPWCLGVPDVFRLRGVYAGSNTSASDITSEFYIDHNQTESYYGLSYLYQNPDSDYVIGSDDELLVEFDCFERTADGGLMSVESYVIDDTKALDNQTTGVNTLEIPEVSTKDRYYDLRETFDFRPTVKATATITNDPSSANTNPSESDFNDLFSSSNIKFPVPEGDIVFDMEYYKPRTDTILLNSKGDFDFMIGRTPSQVNASQLPLYRVNVPAYPSLPRNLSTDVQELIDKRIFSVGSSGQRRGRFTIITESIRDQVQGYTMEEIAQLERRISILEYYTNLSETENKVKELSIPSSIDSSIERFKFGFYVDNFSDYQFTNVSDPQFNATIFEYVLQPASSSYNIPLKIGKKTRDLLTGNKVIFPYNRKNLLSQSFATTGPPVPPESDVVQPPSAPAWSKVCQSIINRNQEWTEVNTPSQYAAVENGVWSGKVEESIFTLTSNTDASGQAIELYFQLDYGTDRIIVEQSQNPNFSSSTIVFSTEDNQSQVEDLTNEDKRYLRNQQIESYYYPEPEDWDDLDWSDADPDDGDLTASRNAGFLKWMGKFDINYDPSLGRYLKVTVQKAGPFFLYHICYPADAIEDPVYNTLGPANRFASDAPAPFGTEPDPAPEPERDVDTSGGSSPSCPPSVHEQLYIQRGLKPNRCKQPKYEEPPVAVIEPLPDPDEEIDVEEPIEHNDPGEDRRALEKVVWTKQPIDVEPVTGPINDVSIVTPTDPLETAIDIVDRNPPTTFQPIVGGGGGRVIDVTKISLV